MITYMYVLESALIKVIKNIIFISIELIITIISTLSLDFSYMTVAVCLQFWSLSVCIFIKLFHFVRWEHILL